jgi:drug/metabolite transporter (DMT)-like permease
MRLPVIVWILLGTIWGSTWLFIKIGLEDLPPFTFAGIRFVISAIPLLVILILQRKKLPTQRSDWVLMIGTGLLIFALNYGLVFWGEGYISSGLTAILYTTFPLFGLILAHFMLPTEQITFRKLAGVLIGMAGVALIFSNQIQIHSAMAIWGSLAIVLASFSTAVANVQIKARGGHLDPIVLTTVQMIVGFVPLLLIGISVEGNPFDLNWTPKAILSLLYLALVGSSLAFAVLYWLIKNMEVTKTQLMPLLSTLIAVLLGSLTLGEQLTWETAAGGAAVLIGLAIATYRRRRGTLDPVGGGS